MLPPPSAPVLARWTVPHGDAPYADQLAKVAARHARRHASGDTSSVLVYVLLGVLVAVLVLVVGWGLVLPLLGGLLVVAALLVLWPRQMAKAWRSQSVFFEPYTVTLDADGLHLVSPSVATHTRWRVFSAAAVDGDVLVISHRGAKAIRVLSLAPLDPGLDRGWLVQELGRLIEADAVNLATPPSVGLRPLG